MVVLEPTPASIDSVRAVDAMKAHMRTILSGPDPHLSLRLFNHEFLHAAGYSIVGISPETTGYGKEVGRGWVGMKAEKAPQAEREPSKKEE